MAGYGDHEVSDDPLQILRHSTAHLLAAAVTELYPGVKYAIGPAIKEPPGFYYDFDFGQQVSDAQLPAIESRMRRLANADIPYVHEVLPREQAIEEFRQRGQDYKLELIADKVSGDGVSVYRTGDFLDLCLGPHIRSTRDIKAFKLQRVSGAYWRGDEKKPQLTRIYGTAWQSQKELDDYMKFLEEAEKRDHKKLGKDLKLFAVDDRVGPGLPLWLPDGATIRRELERFIVDEELSRGYLHVRTPDVARLDLYRQSGHAQLYSEYMYPPMKFEDGEELELRPVNCPHHIVIYQTELRSYRELPLRIAEIGFQVRDAHRREFTNSTVQVDFQLPQRFDLEYVAEDGTRKRPVMVHRGAAGAMERLFSYLIERYAGAFPTWLHPTQVVVASTKDEFNEYAEQVGARLRASRIRVLVDTRSERLNRKIRDARLKKVPYIAVVGETEAPSGHVNVNDRTNTQVDMPLDSFVSMIATEVAERRR